MSIAAATAVVPATTIRHATSDDCAATTVLSTTTTAAATTTTTGTTDSFAQSWRLARVGRRFRADILLFLGDRNIHLGQTRRLLERERVEKREREYKFTIAQQHISQHFIEVNKTHNNTTQLRYTKAILTQRSSRTNTSTLSGSIFSSHSTSSRSHSIGAGDDKSTTPLCVVNTKPSAYANTVAKSNALLNID